MKHLPVLLNEVLQMIEPVTGTFGLFVDGTFGRGGHTRSILETYGRLKVLALDCDQAAVDHGQEKFSAEIQDGRLELVRSNFSELGEVLGERRVCGILLDLGVSSPQLDEGVRGFSFYHDGPLDMRMDQRQEFTAADIVNTWPERDLIELFRNYGEVRRPQRVVLRIVEDRKKRPFTTTRELAGLIERTEGWARKGHHPATNYFLALRIEVNQELKRIEEVLPEMVSFLQPEGRLLVITFHSLEDRIVKNVFKRLASEKQGVLVNKKVIVAERAEVLKNARSRSAKLRVFSKGGDE